jgi:hypothetical protein
MTIPPATLFERELSEAISEAWGRNSGTVWTAAARILSKEFSMAPDEVGLISVTDEGVVNNRPLSAGLITKPRKILIIPVSDAVGLDREEAAIVNLMPKTRHLTTVGLASKSGDDGSDKKIWRVQRLIQVEGLGIAEQVIRSFPMVRKIRTEPLVPFGGEHESMEIPGTRSWLFASSPPTSSPATLVLAPNDPLRREVTPHDRILFCNRDLDSAMAAGTITRLSSMGRDLAVLVESVVVFASPIRIKGVNDD